MPILIPIILGLLFVGLLIWNWQKNQKQLPLSGIVEFWVYGNVQRVPPTEALMDSIVNKNPFNRPNLPAITAREGILFSDIRLHIAVAKRENNPEAFRPDLFTDNSNISSSALAALSDSSSLVNLHYSSLKQLSDGRHLQFITHLALGMSRLTKGLLIYDTICERFWLPEALSQELEIDSDAERFEIQVRVIWKAVGEGYKAKTLGLRKVGRLELETALQAVDAEILATELLSLAARRLYEEKSSELPMDFEVAGAHFTVRESARDSSVITVQILRNLAIR